MGLGHRVPEDRLMSIPKNTVILPMDATWEFKDDLHSRVKAGTQAKITGFALVKDLALFATEIPMVRVEGLSKNPTWFNVKWFTGRSK